MLGFAGFSVYAQQNGLGGNIGMFGMTIYEAH